jgi:uncharacterized membrane protein YfcA
MSPLEWLFGALSALLLGMAKTGIPGAGILAVPLMFLAVGATLGDRAGPGALLPLLCIADWCALAMHRQSADGRIIRRLAPWVVLGLGLGWAILAVVDGTTLRRISGGIVLAMAAIHVWRQRQGHAPHGPVAAAMFGITAGCTTMIANAAGPVMGLYLLGMHLDKHRFMGTGAVFFAIINLLKVPIYVQQGLITGGSLAVDLWLLPLLLGGALLGRAVFHRLSQRRFEQVVLFLTVLSATALLR